MFCDAARRDIHAGSSDDDKGMSAHHCDGGRLIFDGLVDRVGRLWALVVVKKPLIVTWPFAPELSTSSV